MAGHPPIINRLKKRVQPLLALRIVWFSIIYFLCAFNLYGQEVYTIPVAVHMVYNKEVEKLPPETVADQIDAFNRDYNLLNTDTDQVIAGYQSRIGNARIRFKLGKYIDDEGIERDAITYTKTTKVGFPQVAGNSPVKKTALGGHDPFNPAEYLNIWVCNITKLGSDDRLEGFAEFPGSYASQDGIVISYRYFSSINNGRLGRTPVHEAGHWLGLYHLDGGSLDGGGCKDDFVDDTPVHAAQSRDAPAGIYNPNECSIYNPLGRNYNNYMDYSDENVVVMFTKGQVERMRRAFEPGGPREYLLDSEVTRSTTPLKTNCCDAPTKVTAQNVGNNEATIAWEGPAGEYQIRYRPTLYTEWQTAGTVTGNQANLSGLHEFNTYVAQVKRLCDSDESGWRGALFTTTGDCGEVEIETLTSTSNTITVNWKATDNNRYFEVSALPDSGPVKHTISVEVFGANTVTLTGLEPNTPYSVFVVGVCVASAGGVTSVVFGEISTQPGCFAPLSAVASNPTQNSFEVDVDITGSSDVQFLELQVASKDFSYNEELLNITPGTYTVSGLTPNNRYTWRARTRCANGEHSAWIVGNDINTLSNNCPDPAYVLTDLQPGGFDAYVGIAAEPAIVSFDIELTATDGSFSQLYEGLTNEPESYTNLPTGKTYTWRARASCGSGAYSNWINADAPVVLGQLPGNTEIEAQTITVYPNPATAAQVITIEQTEGSELITELTVINSSGEAIRHEQLEGEQKVNLVLGSLPTGLYLIILQNGSQRMTKRLLIAN